MFLSYQVKSKNPSVNVNQPIWAGFTELPLVWGLAVDSILGGLNLCETTAWLCNWKQGPPAEQCCLRPAALPYLPNYASLDINSRISAAPSRWKTLLSELKSDTHSPKIPWIFWEDGASTHLQQRSTITPPKTRSSPARKGEPARAEMMDGTRALNIKPRDTHGWGWDKTLLLF